MITPQMPASASEPAVPGLPPPNSLPKKKGVWKEIDHSRAVPSQATAKISQPKIAKDTKFLDKSLFRPRTNRQQDTLSCGQDWHSANSSPDEGKLNPWSEGLLGPQTLSSRSHRLTHKHPGSEEVSVNQRHPLLDPICARTRHMAMQFTY